MYVIRHLQLCAQGALMQQTVEYFTLRRVRYPSYLILLAEHSGF